MSRFLWSSALLTCAATFALGCGGGPRPVGPDGFDHVHFEYRVPGPGAAIGGADWLLDNYRIASDGTVGETKRGAEYQAPRRMDLDGDGIVERLGQAEVYDLLFHHRTSAASMWIRTVPLPAQLAETELRVLMRLYVEAIAGTGVTLADLGEGRVDVRERRYATREIDAGPAVVGGREARMATIEIADIDQMRLSAEHRWQRARVVLVRTDLLWAPDVRAVRPSDLRPVLLIAGYTNLPEDFDRQAADFDALLARVQFDTPRVTARRDAVLACVPGASRVRVFVGYYGAETPDAVGDQRACVRRVLESAPLPIRRSYGFRSAQTTLAPLQQLGGTSGGDERVPPAHPPSSPFEETPSDPQTPHGGAATEEQQAPDVGPNETDVPPS